MINVGDKLKDLLVDQLGVDRDEITDTADIVDDLGADSLDTVEIVMACEEEFSVEIADEEAEGIRKVCDAVALITRKLEAKAATAK